MLSKVNKGDCSINFGDRDNFSLDFSTQVNKGEEFRRADLFLLRGCLLE